MTPTVIDVAVTPGAAEPPPDAVVDVEAAVVDVVVEALVDDEQPAASSPTPIASAIGRQPLPPVYPHQHTSFVSDRPRRALRPDSLTSGSSMDTARPGDSSDNRVPCA